MRVHFGSGDREYTDYIRRLMSQCSLYAIIGFGGRGKRISGWAGLGEQTL